MVVDFLVNKNKNHILIVYDCTRPLSVISNENLVTTIAIITINFKLIELSIRTNYIRLTYIISELTLHSSLIYRALLEFEIVNVSKLI